MYVCVCVREARKKGERRGKRNASNVHEVNVDIRDLAEGKRVHFRDSRKEPAVFHEIGSLPVR